MPICTLHLLSLSCQLPQFLSSLSASSLEPLTVARVVRWVILPSSISTSILLARNIRWDVLLILPSTSPLPADIQSLVAHQFTLQAGVPSRLISDFAAKNERLLRPNDRDIPPLAVNRKRVAASSQGLELSPELQAWIHTFSKDEGVGAVSMLNLLAFKEGMKEEYLKYGKAFAESIGSKRGGIAKIVGSVVYGKDEESEGKWDEIALAHYPSIRHFEEMLGSEDYQEVNQRHRVGSLKDTCILCTTELGLPWGNSSLWEGKAKL